MVPEPLNGRPSYELVKEPVLNIMIIEDNPGDIIIVRKLLKSSGLLFNLTEASSLKSALALFTDNNFDIILLDLGLPDSIGLETLKKLQVFKVVPPVVVMTGLDDEDTALESLREGAQDYLVKNRLTSEIILRSIKYSIERKLLQNIQKKNTQRFSLLSNTTAFLNECDDISLIYKIICDCIKLLLDKTISFSIMKKNSKKRTNSPLRVTKSA